jgi:hypothetical protein
LETYQVPVLVQCHMVLPQSKPSGGAAAAVLNIGPAREVEVGSRSSSLATSTAGQSTLATCAKRLLRPASGPVPACPEGGVAGGQPRPPVAAAETSRVDPHPTRSIRRQQHNCCSRRPSPPGWQRSCCSWRPSPHAPSAHLPWLAAPLDRYEDELLLRIGSAQRWMRLVAVSVR